MSKTVLVTGTTSGIGEAFCNLFAAQKYNLILVARNRAALEKQAASLKEKGITVYTIICDLTAPNAACLIYKEVSAANLSVDVLINNAGFNEAGYFVDTDLQKEMDMIKVHTSVITELTKFFLPDMISRRHGKILNIGSIGSYMPCPSDTVYAATKAYVLSFSNGLHQELKKTGVTVTCLCPGATETRFAAKANISNTLLFKLFVMNPTDVAAIGYKNMMRGKRTITAGLYNKILIFLTRLSPVSITNPIAEFMMRKEA